MEARQLIVKERDQGARLDKWLCQKIPYLSRNRIKHLIDHGKVLVNHRRVLIAGWELESKDAVEVRMSVGCVPDLSLRGGSLGEPTKQSHRFLDVLFEDKDLIIVNKPTGVLTEPKTHSPHEHLLGMIKSYLKRKFKESRGSYVKLIHRLDKDTSGVIVAAKSKVGEQLENQFRDHKVERHYIALVEGAILKEEGKIDLPLEKGDFEGGKKIRIASKGGGMPSVTQYRVTERYSNATLVHLRVETGRTHQIRAHLAAIGHPIIGDTTYGASLILFKRQALHASFLAFRHPGTKKWMRFETKLPQDLQELIDDLRGN